MVVKMLLDMDASCNSLPSASIFQELQRIHDTGFFSPVHSLEDKFQQVNKWNFTKCWGLPPENNPEPITQSETTI